ncbi:hypothetical protein [Schlesneria sp. T3-172]|uniref:hypothetical protein n=1 Tax=Schlesneria sphaerica TaxID=3373610 RepID=UPI0037C92A99
MSDTNEDLAPEVASFLEACEQEDQQENKRRQNFEAQVCSEAFVFPAAGDSENENPRYDCGNGQLSYNPAEAIPRLYRELGIEAGLSGLDWRDVANCEFNLGIVDGDVMDFNLAFRIGKLLRWRIAKRGPVQAVAAATLEKKTKSTPNELMIAALAANPVAAETWTAREWASRIGYSAATVTGTQVWKRLSQLRHAAKLDRPKGNQFGE